MDTSSISASQFRVPDVHSFVKKLLILLIVLLPFQETYTAFMEESAKEHSLFKAMTHSDEVSGLILIVFAVSFIFLKPAYFKLYDAGITKPLVAFMAVSFISIVWNGVYAPQGFFGVYNLLKNIAIIYLFASLRWRKEEFLTLIKWITVIAVFLAVAGIISEALALYGIDPGGTVHYREPRFGLYRVASLVGINNLNHLGKYSILALFLLYATVKNKTNKYTGLFLILVLIFLTMSRQTWLGLVVLLVLMNRKWIFPVILIAAGIAFITLSSQISYDPDEYYRAFTYLEAWKLLKAHPVLGVGPGMFGSVASVVFNSPYYDEWPVRFAEAIRGRGGLDAFWPAVLAETGMAGFLSYLLIFGYLYKKIDAVKQYFSNDPLLYNIGTVLKYYIVALIIMCLFSGLNKPFVVFTFFSICGMYLSLYYQRTNPGSIKEQIPQ